MNETDQSYFATPYFGNTRKSFVDHIRKQTNKSNLNMTSANFSKLAFDGNISSSKLINDQQARNNKFVTIEKKLTKLDKLNKETRNYANKLKISNSLPE